MTDQDSSESLSGTHRGDSFDPKSPGSTRYVAHDVRTDGGTNLVGEAIPESLGNVSVGVLSIDDRGEIESINDQGSEIFERGADEVTGTALETVVGESLLVDAVETARSTHTEEPIEGYDETLAKWIEGVASPNDDSVFVLFRDVTESKQLRDEISRSETAIEQLHSIAADPDRSVSEKIEEMLAIGTERFGIGYGFLTHIEDGVQEIVASSATHPGLQPGETAPLSEAYCRHTIEQPEPLAISDAPEEGFESDPAYERFELDCYLGATIQVDGGEFGTVCFADDDPREIPFRERERSFAELLTDWIRYLLERQEYERELEEQRAFTESLINSLSDPLYAFDESAELIRWNRTFAEITGYEAAELEGMHATAFVADADADALLEAFDAVRSGEHVSVEARLETRDGEHILNEFSGAPLREKTESIIGVVGIGRDISERDTHRERLSGLLDATRSLMQARDREQVADIAVNAAEQILGFDTSVFRLYDSESETLVPAAVSAKASELLGERPVYEVGTGHPGEVFASGEPRVVGRDQMDLADIDLETAATAMYYPVGVHGTISVCSTEADAFDETDKQILGLLAATAGAACMRAKREQEVREARQHTERVLERVNGLVEDTIEVLVQSTSRDEIETGVVQELAAATPYTFAWIGQPDVATDGIRPTAWAGDGALAIQDETFDIDASDDPVGDAFRTGEPVILEDIEHSASDHWQALAGDDTVNAVLVVPLVYKETTYGVLAVCAADVADLDERERIVLQALGSAVANAINAVERGRILDATEIIELDFSVGDTDLLLNQLSGELDERLEVVSTEHRSDGNIRLYLTLSAGDPDAFIDLATEAEPIKSVTTIVATDDESLFEVVVDESLLSTLAEYGAVPTEVVADSGLTSVSIELPYESEARDVFDLVDSRYAGTDLLGYHERERPVETRQEFTAALSDRLTDRQETALRTAYLGGFFDWPRDIDGNELAESMDISRPTFHQHLRAAQQKVFEEVFE